MTANHISIQGARQHNLKNIDLCLPKHKLVVITGLSGSGKSTLAFDTLYAEGQRRYVESLSAYARQFLERLEKPDVDLIEGLSPAIAIEQKSAGHNPRSTVGTVTEIYDYLRLLFARVGTAHCHLCGQPIVGQHLDELVDRIEALPKGSRLQILSPVVRSENMDADRLIKGLTKEGYARLRIDGKTIAIESVNANTLGPDTTIELVVDRLIVKTNMRNRLADSLELAAARSDGRLLVERLPDERLPKPEIISFSEQAVCPRCDIRYPEFSPASFSFNSPQGACPDCDGLGATTEFDPQLIIPNPSLSLRDGAVMPWAHRNSVYFIEFIESLTRFYGADIYTPFRELPTPFMEVLLHGSEDQAIPFMFERDGKRVVETKPFEGIIPNLQRRYLETDSHASREEIKRYMNFRTCSTCRGSKLRAESRAVQLAKHSIAQVTALSIPAAKTFLQTLELTGKHRVIADRIVKELVDRLGFLEAVGLSYLTLDRSAATLSGGESQRIRLATQIGSKLSGVLYVLDEPSIGLHQRDNQRLLDTLLQLRDLGNTLLVVEHDEETIRQADHVVDMGPGAGVSGGEVVFSGTPAQMLTSEKSLTGNYLSGRKSIEVPKARREGSGKHLVIQGAAANNLQHIDVSIPLGCLVCVTGVSGSGKSTLVLETLYPALAQRLNHAHVVAGAHKEITGLTHVDKVVHINQNPIGRTPRSNPGTYTGIFADIRALFARTPEARMRGYKAGRFSFNVKGGRCEACSGDGIIKIEMHFLPDIYVTCDVCKGHRYNRETLEVRYKGKNIKEVLALTVNQAASFFGRIQALRPKLETLQDVGLGYIQLGQPATTLSGGEAQRVKLARELSKRATGRTIYIMDEPTTGLHADDIRRLMEVLARLVSTGNTVLVIEHNLDVIKCADHVIDLGPEGGDGGGRLVACGTPEQIAASAQSHTGRYLAAVLDPADVGTSAD